MEAFICLRAPRKIMGINVWIITYAVLHSILLSLCNSHIIRTIHVSSKVPVGYEITKLSKVEPIPVLESETTGLFGVNEHGSIVTKGVLFDFAGSSISLLVRNGLDDKILDSLQIHILEPSLPSDNLVFQQSNYVGHIDENRPAGSKISIVGHLIVSGCDNVKYSLINGSDSFHLETIYFGSTHNNLVTSLKSFNREVQDLYKVVLIAVCSGFSTSTIIEIHILDVNDISPKFKSREINVLTSTDQSWREVTTVQAIDGDQNEKLSYTLSGSSEFYIDKDSGKIYSEENYVHAGSYDVSVVATDSVGHRSEPIIVYIEVQSPTLKFERKLEQIHSRRKRSTISINKTHDIVENSTFSRPLFSVASVKNPPSGERYEVVSESVSDLIQAPNNIGEVYLLPGRRLDFENENHRRIILVYNRTNIDNPGGKS
ncbi:beta-catenin binding [Mactra antiquata]